MEEKVWCQSCSMPLIKEKELGTNKDGSKNEEYCIYCYKDGEYTDKEVTMEGMVEMCVPFMVENGMQEDEARNIMNNTLPNLKRWKCSCTDECASGYNPNCTCTSSECHCTEK